jgi:hypothetical protein
LQHSERLYLQASQFGNQGRVRPKEVDQHKSDMIPHVLGNRFPALLVLENVKVA